VDNRVTTSCHNFVDTKQKRKMNMSFTIKITSCGFAPRMCRDGTQTIDGGIRIVATF